MPSAGAPSPAFFSCARLRPGMPEHIRLRLCLEQLVASVWHSDLNLPALSRLKCWGVR